MGFSGEDHVPIPVMAEVNLQFAGGPRAAFARLDRLWERVSGETPQHVADQYATGWLTMRQVQRLVSADAAPVAWPQRSIHRVWPDFPVELHVDASCVTVKADAARRSFNAYGCGIVWAVVDTGIDGTHPHFQGHHTLDDPHVKELHRDFTGADSPLTDEVGHGTHVAGIIAGAVEPWLTGEPQPRYLHVTEATHNPASPEEPMNVPRTVADPAQLAGMAPRARLVSLKAVRSGGTRDDRVNRVIAALAYVREVNGQSADGMRIHGVNLSVGYEFDPRWFACGRSPLCKEVDKLVRSGVAVVVAAGNTGYGAVDPEFAGPATLGLGMTINDPGNAERAITVGSTHRDAPHAYGVSYFSSKGPTGDGRAKPDLVAPGERITSCAAGAKLAAVLAGEVADDTAVYVQQTGTSMAAPHVSGALAALMSVRREFIGSPDELKRIVVESATPLRRRPEFQGAGLLDLMRALQSI
jgi:subtilisin family serine protease